MARAQFLKWLGGKGATGVFQEPTASTASAQVSLLETLTSQGYTGWGVSAVTADSLTTPIAQAEAKGLSIVAYDSPLPGTQLYIGTPNTTAGCDAGKAMTQAIGSGRWSSPTSPRDWATRSAPGLAS